LVVRKLRRSIEVATPTTNFFSAGLSASRKTLCVATTRAKWSVLNRRDSLASEVPSSTYERRSMAVSSICFIDICLSTAHLLELLVDRLGDWIVRRDAVKDDLGFEIASADDSQHLHDRG